MRLRADHVAGAFFVAIGALVIALSGDLPFGDLAMPGAGFLPYIIAVLIVLFGASLFLRAKESPVFAEIAWDDGKHALQVLVIASIAIAFYASLGFIVTMSLMMIALLLIIERKNIVFAVLYSAVIVVVTYLVFVHLLVSPLPPGIVGYI